MTLLFLVLSQEHRLMFTVLEMSILIYWSESNSWIYFYIVLNENRKIYWFEQSLTGLGPEDRCSLWELCLVKQLPGFPHRIWLFVLVFIGGIVDHHCLSFHNYFEWELLSKTIDTGIFYSVIINIILYSRRWNVLFLDFILILWYFLLHL